MLNIAGPKSRFCDGMSRRSWLRIGGLGLGGLALPDILRGEARAGVRNPAKGIIMVLLPGGPSHLDMYDLKPTAPSEIRGEIVRNVQRPDSSKSTRIVSMGCCDFGQVANGIGTEFSRSCSLL